MWKANLEFNSNIHTTKFFRGMRLSWLNRKLQGSVFYRHLNCKQLHIKNATGLLRKMVSNFAESPEGLGCKGLLPQLQTSSCPKEVDMMEKLKTACEATSMTSIRQMTATLAMMRIRWGQHWRRFGLALRFCPLCQLHRQREASLTVQYRLTSTRLVRPLYCVAGQSAYWHLFWRGSCVELEVDSSPVFYSHQLESQTCFRGKFEYTLSRP